VDQRVPLPPLKLTSQPPIGEAGKGGAKSPTFPAFFTHSKGLGEGVRSPPLASSPTILSGHFQGPDELGEEVVNRGGDAMAFAPCRDLGV
jgi:hypothetical protein